MQYVKKAGHMLDFKDISDDTESSGMPETEPLGVVLFEPDGSWHAAHPDMKEPASGVGPLTGLPQCLWLCSLPYEQAQGIAGASRGVTLRADQWLRVSMSSILGELRLQSAGQHQKAQYASEVSNRIFRLTQELILRTFPKEKKVSSRVFSRLRLAPSLATGIMFLNEDALSATRPSEKGMQEAFQRVSRSAMSFGARDTASEDIRLNFRFPRFSHALQLTSGPIPDGTAGWKQARRPDEMSGTEFLGMIRHRGEPAIFRALCSAKSSGNSIVPDVFLNGGGRSETRRTHLLDEEITFLDQHFDIDFDGVLVGKGWKPGLTRALLDKLVTICGGQEAAACSISAGILAENILASASRRKRGDPDSPAGEALWLATRDRIAMAPAMMRLAEAGAIPAAAHLGTISVDVPPDPEILAMVVQAAWEAGLSLCLEEVQLLQEQGVTLPHDIETFGGLPVDYPLSAIVHQGQRKVVLAMDRVMSMPVDDRVKTFRQAFR